MIMMLCVYILVVLASSRRDDTKVSEKMKRVMMSLFCCVGKMPDQ
jgi:hypothetical protein